METRSLPKDIINSHPVLVPQHVLQLIWIIDKDKEIAQVLIQWQGMSTSDATSTLRTMLFLIGEVLM